MQNEWKNTNLRKTIDKNLFKIQLKMAYGIANIMAVSKSRYFKGFFFFAGKSLTKRVEVPEVTVTP